MPKNLNLRVDDETFFDFHRVKSMLKTITNQEALEKMIAMTEWLLTNLHEEKLDEIFNVKAAMGKGRERKAVKEAVVP